jgi:DNA primase
MPDPATYYGEHVAKLGKANATGWAQGQCPFHDDHNKSLSVCLTSERGGWRCFAGCGGGDLVGFHSLLRGLDFRAAVRELLEVRA